MKQIATTGLMTFIFTAATLGISAAHAASNDLFISEYIEGSSNNKAIEIFNGTGADVNLSDYQLQYFFNGSTSPGTTISLSGTVSAGDVFVVAHSSAVSAITSAADLTTGSSFFNGDDAVALVHSGAIIDVIGQIGVDPGSQWGSGATSTQDNTLRRQASLCDGDSNGADGFDPAQEWDGFAQDTFGGLGTHDASCGGGGGGGGTTDELFLSEYIEGSSNNKAVEIFNGTGASVDLSGYELRFFFNGSTSAGTSIALAGSVADGDVFVVANSSATAAILAEADLTTGSRFYNGDDAVALVRDGDIIDVIGQIGDDPGREWGSGLTSTQNNTLRRLADICGGDSDGSDAFDPALEWDGFSRDTFDDLGAHTANCDGDGGGGGDDCTNPTLIHAVQGSGASSPLANTSVTVNGIVVADFQASGQIGGFFVQEEDADADANANTSEGIFVEDTATNVQVGDRVCVSGTVSENFARTQIGAATVTVEGSGFALPTAPDVTLPFASPDEPERYEGMHVHLAQELTVTETFLLGRFGEVSLSSGGRLMQPTNVARPGPQAAAVQAANDLNRILIDDGISAQNPDPMIFPSPELTASNTLRSGYTATGIVGALDFAFGSYRVLPTIDPTFVDSNNPRLSTPPSVGGDITVASFNVLNYFNGDGQGGGFPTARGADTAAEFDRQRDKIIAAITAMSADIIGLMEIENDGYGANSAIQDLVDGLNAAAPAGTNYDFIDPQSSSIGTDAIAVGIIYRVETVAPVGSAEILDSSVDSRFDDTKNRPALAQTFVAAGTNSRVTIAVNHLKSKGSSCSSIGDPDTGDGQGNCNLTRTSAAEALVDWLATDPTSGGTSDVLIIGDLNAYAQEDPITAIKAGGYTDLIDALVGSSSSYSFIFDGQAGYLDHALATSSLASRVTGIVEWHINTDEPVSLDYNVEFKTANHVNLLYSPGPLRASDHDPVLIGLSTSP